jgi:hypothetical protein
MKPRGSTKSFHVSLNLMPGHPRATLKLAADEAIALVWLGAGISLDETTRGVDDDASLREVKLAHAALDRDGSCCLGNFDSTDGIADEMTEEAEIEGEEESMIFSKLLEIIGQGIRSTSIIVGDSERGRETIGGGAAAASAC